MISNPRSEKRTTTAAIRLDLARWAIESDLDPVWWAAIQRVAARPGGAAAGDGLGELLAQERFWAPPAGIRGNTAGYERYIRASAKREGARLAMRGRRRIAAAVDVDACAAPTRDPADVMAGRAVAVAVTRDIARLTPGRREAILWPCLRLADAIPNRVRQQAFKARAAVRLRIKAAAEALSPDAWKEAARELAESLAA